MTDDRAIPDLRDPDSASWWAAIDRRQLLLPRCGDCGRYFFPPARSCPYCASSSVTLEPATGEGTVYSWIVVHHAQDPAFADQVPYTILAVDLAEGVRIVGRQLDDPEPRPDLPVTATFYRAGGRTLLGFKIGR
jgi:uncharacterized protein